jgi:hypothetical protein
MSAKVIILSIITVLLSTFAKAQVDLNYYLPDIQYDQSLPTPESILGYQIGEWHPSHDHLEKYLKALCEASPKCQYEEYARTHEHRPLFFLRISNPDNLNNLDNIIAQRDKLVDPFTAEVDMEVPMVLYQGYSIHGNESSGASASLLVAYYLLAGEGKYLDELLSSSVIFIDPCYNPDGLHRFSTWANMHKHKTLTSDPNSREFNEVWPGGRTNHYWFDLNRDWLFNIHPSSKGRINTFQKWKPDILTDHHEMGTNSTFFFQPGVPSRTNPNTPQKNQDITGKIAQYHRQNLDSLGCQYFSKKRFDDYYYGKGSTYPDIQGCIGILFEQASSRGHLQESDNGLLSFPFTIRNQVTTSLSTQRAALALKDKIIAYKRDFYTNQEANRKGSFIFQSADAYRTDFLVTMLQRHDIQVNRLANSQTIDGTYYDEETSFVVSKNQRQSGLIKTIFEPVNEFRDSIFYDVSAWTVPLALDMDFADLTEELPVAEISQSTASIKIAAATDDSKGLLIDWSKYEAPQLLYKLMQDSTDLSVLTKATTIDGIDYPSGTVYLGLPEDMTDRKKVIDRIEGLGVENTTWTNWVPKKRTKMQQIEKPSVAIIVGQGINPYEAGSTWYQIDQRLEMPVTMLDFRQLGRADLSRYNVIIMPDGRYGELGTGENLKKWVRTGGTLLAMRRSIRHLTNKKWIKLQERKTTDSIPDTDLARGAQVVGGAIFQAKINTEHPLFYGYEDEILPVFKRGTQFYDPLKEKYTPLSYSKEALLSGYASSQNRELASGAAGLTCHKYGAGKIIAMVDNPNFRGYWLGGSKLFANCLFMHKAISEGNLAD